MTLKKFPRDKISRMEKNHKKNCLRPALLLKNTTRLRVTCSLFFSYDMLFLPFPPIRMKIFSVITSFSYSDTFRKFFENKLREIVSPSDRYDRKFNFLNEIENLKIF